MKEVFSKTGETYVSQPHPNVCILHSYQMFSRKKKSGKFIRKFLVTTPILKGYMVPEASSFSVYVCLAFMKMNDLPKISIITLDEVSNQSDSSKVFY